jgi:hypothetical protein
MSDQMSVTLVLTGGRAGATCVLGKYQFVNGECPVHGQANAVGSMLRYMGRIYQAFPKGSEELARAQKEFADGQADADKSSGGGTAEPVSGNLQPDGSANEAATDSVGDDGSGNASSEHVPEGHGLQHSRINEALTLLDHSDDEHWTQGGKPAVHVVSEIMNENVSRADINAAAPDFKRKEG